MKILTRMTIAMLATVAIGLSTTSACAMADDTEDILLMRDGRELHGQIISESSTEIVFEFVDRSLGLRTTLRINPADVAMTRKDVPLENAPDPTPAKPAAPSKPASGRAPATGTPSNDGPRFGTSHRDADAGPVTTVYVVPMQGQMGTDIHKSVYEDVIKDILAVKPDIVIYVLDSSEQQDLMIDVSDPRDTRGANDIEGYRELVTMFKQKLPSSYQQVMWVKDAVGFSALLPFAWSDFYMAPNARLVGVRSVIERTGAEGWSDPDVKAKMKAAWGGSAKAFFEYGGYDMELADAMLWPEKVLSATFRGREVIFALNTDGEIVVDSNDKATIGLQAKAAEDLLLSDGTVDSLDDLTFLLGYREYREVGSGQQIVEDYIESWRRAYDLSKATMKDYQQHMDWAGGNDGRKYLGQAKNDLQKVIRFMDQYEAVEIRWRQDTGLSKAALERRVEELTEELRSGRGGGGGGGRSGGFGGGGG